MQKEILKFSYTWKINHNHQPHQTELINKAKDKRQQEHPTIELLPPYI